MRRIRQGARENNSHQIVSIGNATAITTKTMTLRIWKSTDDHSRAIPATAAPTPRITTAGHQRIGGGLEELFIASTLLRQTPGGTCRNQTGQTIMLKGHGISKA